jgi:hypothetical protein
MRSVLGAVLLFGVSGWCLFDAGCDYAYGHWSGNWTRGVATITKNCGPSTSYKGVHLFERYRHSYEPDISYSYKVNGHEFTGHHVSYPNPVTDRQSCQSIANQYPLDTQIAVYYDKQYPGLSCLKPGSDDNATTAQAVAGAFGLFLSFLSYMWSSTRYR